VLGGNFFFTFLVLVLLLDRVATRSLLPARFLPLDLDLAGGAAAGAFREAVGVLSLVG